MFCRPLLFGEIAGEAACSAPILDAARQRETPVVLQTFKLDNLRKYEHMGFQLSKEVASDTIPLICYHMIHP